MKEELSCGTVSSHADPDQNYWDQKWEKKETGWDIGYASPAIAEYMLQYENKDAEILIPGCGNAYEAEFLWDLGFRNITVLDFAPTAAAVLKEKFQEKKGISVICEDFFNYRRKYDLVIEQTFFCAIPTLIRNQYAEKMHELLNEGGRIVGVMFNRNFEKKGPPFGGSMPEYHFIFRKYFEIKKMEECYSSIEARKGSEIFINLKKR